MAFTVEDGSGVVGANAYITVAYADEYFSDRGEASWPTLTTEQKQIAIIKASSYLDSRFGLSYVGCQGSKSQGLNWPRWDAYKINGWWIAGDEMPDELLDACSEYSLVAATVGSLLPTGPTSGTASPKIGSTIKVGPITVSDKYSDSAASSRNTGIDVVSSSTIPEYPAADLLLQPILESNLSTDLQRG